MTTLRVRTNDNLNQIFRSCESHAWRVNINRVRRDITTIQIVSWNGTRTIEAEFDRENSSIRLGDGRLIIRFRNPRWINTNITFRNQNPVNYV